MPTRRRFDAVFTRDGRRSSARHRAPSANAFAERWVGSVRRELLDRTLSWNRRQLEQLLGEYVEHYNTHRPHRALQQNPPAGRVHPPIEMTSMRILRKDRLGGLIREYVQVA
jgi:hypothetical protein